MPDKGMVGFGRGRSNDSTVKAIDDAFFEGESGDGNLWHLLTVCPFPPHHSISPIPQIGNIPASLSPL
jgi:hypothetical protein